MKTKENKLVFPSPIVSALLATILLLITWSSAHAVLPQVAAGNYHTVGLKSDGTVMAVGDNRFGQLDVDSWTDIMQVAAGMGSYLDHTVRFLKARLWD